MNMDKDELDLEELADEALGDKPEEAAKVLIDRLNDCYTQSSSFISRRKAAADWRYCRWDGKTDDGRRRTGDNRDVMPFEGAPDTEIHLVDGLVNEEVDILFAAFFGARVQAVPNSFGNLKQSAYVSVFLQWLRNNALRKELLREVELLANMQVGDDPGIGILGVYWEPNSRTKRISASLQELSEMAAMVNVNLPAAAMLDTENDERANLLAVVFPLATEKAIERALEEFDEAAASARRAGDVWVASDLDGLRLTVAVREGRGLPRFEALRPASDIWMDWEIDRIEDQPFVFVREELEESELRGRVLTHGYDEAWVDKVLEAGPNKRCWDVFLDSDAEASSLDAGDGDFDSESHRVYEVLRCHRKVINEAVGAPETMVSVFSAFVPDMLALDEVDDDLDGCYGFIDFRREHVARGMKETRGVSAIAGVQQNEIKLNRDCRGAALQLATLPPLKYKMIRGGLNAALAPGRQMPVRDMGDMDWMKPPPFPNSAIQMEESVRFDVDEYFGRVRPDGAPTRGQTSKQKKVISWLGNWAEGFALALRLCQKYMDPQEIAEVLSVQLKREVLPDLSGEYSLALHFDMRDLDLEFVETKIKVLGPLLQMDNLGMVDRAGLVGTLLYSVDPYMGANLVQDMDNVTEQEQEDEQNQLMKMFTGQDATYKESGQNNQLRLQVLQSTIQQSPKLMDAYEKDEDFREKVDKRAKHHGFILQQAQNAQTGRMGVEV